MTINRATWSLSLAMVLAAMVLAPTDGMAKRKKPAAEVRPALTAEDSRRYDYFFLEAQLQGLRGNYAGAYDLLCHCRQINPQAAEVYYFLSSYISALDNDSLALAYMNKAVSLRPDNQTYLETLAQNYYKTKDYARAAAMYERLAKANRNRSDLLRILLGIYQERRDYGHMIDCLNRLEQVEGSGEDITLSKVSVYAQKGDRKAALAALRQLVAEHPYDINYQVMMGNWLMQNDGKKEALAIFTAALAKEPDNANVMSSLYDYYKADGDEAKATDCLQRILANPKADTKSKLSMMKTFIQDNEQQGGDSTRVIALFDRMGASSAADPAIAELKLAYMNLKKFPSAAMRHARADLLRVAPDNASVRYDQIMDYWKDQQWDDVARLSRDGTEYSPGELAFYYFLGLSCYQKEENDSALTALQRGVAMVNSDSNPAVVADFYSMMGNLLQEKGRTREAFEAFDNCLKWDADNIECLNNYAYFLSLQDTALNRAAQMSYKTIVKEPKNATFLDTYAWILFGQNRYAEAKIYIDQAVANDTDSVQSAVILEHAGDIYYKNHQPDQALDYWRRASEIGGGSAVLPEKIKQKKYIKDEDKKH